MRSRFAIAVLFALLFGGLVRSQLEREISRPGGTWSPTLFPSASETQTPEQLGSMLARATNCNLESEEVQEIAAGFARRRKQGPEWELRLMNGYERALARHSVERDGFMDAPSEQQQRGFSDGLEKKEKL